MDGFADTAHALVDELARLLAASERGEGPVLTQLDPAAVAQQLDLPRWLATGGMDTSALLAFARTYAELAASNHHPGYLGHQIAPPALPAIMADFLQAVTNNISLVYELAPPGTVIDHHIYRWMLGHAGWSDTGTGTLTNGGTLGNLTALLAARSALEPNSWRTGNDGRLVVLAPRTSHYSIRKAAAVMGLGEQALVPLEVDALGRVDLARLPATIAAVRADGARPIALVANACATATGLHDAVGEIGEFCQAQDIWFHVDGAHGASALLSPRLRHRLDGLPLARSLVWDAHKMLRTSALCTGVLFRDAATFDGLFRQHAAYVFHEDAAEIDIGQRTFETSKPPLGLKLALNLAWAGEGALRSYVEAQYDKAALLREMVRDRDGFECPYEPESNILCFRYTGGVADQLRIRKRLIQEGRFYLTSAQLDGQTYLRAAIMSPQTDESALRDLLDAVVKVADG